MSPGVAAEVEHYLRTGDSDPNHAAWPGANFIESAKRANADLENALIDAVRHRAVRWHPPEAMRDLDVAAFTRQTVERMVRGLFARAEQDAVLGLVERSVVFLTPENIEDVEYDDEEQLWLDLDPDGEDALMQLQGASIRYRIAVGPIAGRKTLRLHTPEAALEGRQQPKRFTAARDGFSLNAAVAWLRPTIAGSWNDYAAMWRAPPLPLSVSAATATAWWSTSSSIPFATAPPT